MSKEEWERTTPILTFHLPNTRRGANPTYSRAAARARRTVNTVLKSKPDYAFVTIVLAPSEAHRRRWLSGTGGDMARPPFVSTHHLTLLVPARYVPYTHIAQKLDATPHYHEFFDP